MMRLVKELPRDESTRYLGHHLVRATNGVAANYRATCRARSRAEFVARVGVVAEESDESAHWLEMLIETAASGSAAQKLRIEAHELEAIFSASQLTAKRRLRASKGA